VTWWTPRPAIKGRSHTHVHWPLCQRTHGGAREYFWRRPESAGEVACDSRRLFRRLLQERTRSPFTPGQGGEAWPRCFPGQDQCATSRVRRTKRRSLSRFISPTCSSASRAVRQVSSDSPDARTASSTHRASPARMLSSSVWRRSNP